MATFSVPVTSPIPNQSSNGPPLPGFNPQLVYSGFVSPTVLTSPTPNELYVADQIGRIYVIRGSQISVFLDLRPAMVTLNPDYDERGLLGLAFPPNYLQTRRFYVFYSSNQASPGASYDNFISEFSANPSGVSDLVTERVLLRIPKMVNYHNGGRLAFGPEGYLYVAVGDGGPQRDLNNHAQDLDVVYGKILRLDVSMPGYYRMPADNPFINTYRARPEIYAYGFRNPWSLTFDSLGLLWVGDVGLDTVEEIDIVVKGGNYGWSLYEGTMPTPWRSEMDRQRASVIKPVFEYTHDWISHLSPHPRTAAIIGGYYRRDVGYVFGDYGGVLMAIQLVNGIWQLTRLSQINEFVRSFGTDAQGNIYVLTASQSGPTGLTGKVYRIDPV